MSAVSSEQAHADGQGGDNNSTHLIRLTTFDKPLSELGHRGESHDRFHLCVCMGTGEEKHAN
jgi:hypothetical protein